MTSLVCTATLPHFAMSLQQGQLDWFWLYDESLSILKIWTKSRQHCVNFSQSAALLRMQKVFRLPDN
ncbi:hypothetical protein P9273_10420 [Mesorhizobium sp. WSM4935]|uniref:hypothetical protein n=1 Tax=Mesorhizobium sp. WSM4935 TaxID=3038547 RepID=UPI0024154F42|nr:hypothetical protein [Mesorhizobium sp. WSM4935]MDG4875511.1 hypothetical protein [Mesorhizobium sp. WSM4935]